MQSEPLPRGLLMITTILLMLQQQAEGASNYYKSCCSRADNKNKEDIVLGGLFPVHRNNESDLCGDVLDLGVQRLEAMVLAVNLVNANDSVLPGLRLGFDIRDTCTQPHAALRNSLDFVVGLDAEGMDKTSMLPRDSAGISGVVGSASSSESISAASLLRLFQTPQISYASTARILSDKTRYEYFLRTLPPDLFQARVMVELVVHFNWTYVIPINSDDVYGREGISAFISELQALREPPASQPTVMTNNSATRPASKAGKSFCVSGHPISISVTATNEEYDEVVYKINEAWIGNASVIVVFGQLATIEGILNAITRHPDHRPLTFIVSDAVGNNLDSSYYTTYHNLITVLPEYRESSRFDQYLSSLDPSTNPNPWFKEYWETVFSCKFGTPVPGTPVCDQDTQSIIDSPFYKQNSKVPFVIDAVFAFAYSIHNMLLDVCNGITICPEAVVERYSRTVLDGEVLLRHLYDTTFMGYSSDLIDFDQNGDQAGGYWVKILQTMKTMTGEYEFVRMGGWNSETLLTMTDNPIYWGESRNQTPPDSYCSAPCGPGEFPDVIEDQASCCWRCEKCKGDKEVSDGTECITCTNGFSPNADRSRCEINRLDYLNWFNPLFYVTLLSSLIGLAFTTIVAVAFIYFRQHPVVKAASRELSSVILTGLYLCFMISLIGIGKPSAATCGINRILFGLSFCFIYSPMLIKIILVHRIFRNHGNAKLSNREKTMVSPAMKLFFTAVLVFIQFAISLAWVLVEVPGIKYIYGLDNTEVICNDTPYTGIIISLLYNSVLLMAIGVYIMLPNEIPEEHNEIKYFAINVFSVLLLWIVFVPLYFTLYFTKIISATNLAAIELIIINISALFTLFPLYCPKLLAIMIALKNKSSSVAPYDGLQDAGDTPANPMQRYGSLHHAIAASKNRSSLNSLAAAIHTNTQAEIPETTASEEITAENMDSESEQRHETQEEEFEEKHRENTSSALGDLLTELTADMTNGIEMTERVRKTSVLEMTDGFESDEITETQIINDNEVIHLTKGNKIPQAWNNTAAQEPTEEGMMPTESIEEVAMMFLTAETNMTVEEAEDQTQISETAEPSTDTLDTIPSMYSV